jgi:methyl-accepting chemotaxis protein
MTMPDFPTNLTNTANDITTVAKDAGYVAVGLGVIGFQKAQVQRQELLKRLGDPRSDIEARLNEVRSDVTKAVHDVTKAVSDATKAMPDVTKAIHDVTKAMPDVTKAMPDITKAVHDVDARVEDVIERIEAAIVPFEQRLPIPARDLANQIHVQAREARSQIRSLIKTSA